MTNPCGDGLSRAWTLRDVKDAVVRRSRVLLLAFGALSAGAVAAVFTAPPIYDGGFKILVKRDRADAVVSGVAGADTLRPDVLSEHELLSQVELLKARDLREKLATESGLTARLLATGEAQTSEEALARATRALERDLTVAPIRKTWLIDVTYRDEDPRMARTVLDSMVRLYFEKHLTLHRPSGTFQFFSEQVERARQEMEAAQADLARFAQTEGVVSAAAEREAALEQATDFDALRAETRAALAEANGRLSAVKRELSRVPSQRTSQVRVLQNPGVIEEIQSRLLTLEMRRTELLQRFTPEYRGVTEIDQQLGAARAALTEALDTPAREETIADNPTRLWLDQEMARAQTDTVALGARLTALSSAVARYRSQAQQLEISGAEQHELLRRLASAEERYRLYTTKQEEARISDALDKTRIANVAIAQAPSLSYEARRRPSLAMLPVLITVSFLLSLALALIVDGLARTDVAPRASAAGAIPPIQAVAWRAGANAAHLAARVEALKVTTDAANVRLAAREKADSGGSSTRTDWIPVRDADAMQGA